MPRGGLPTRSLVQSQKLMARIYPFHATRYNPTAVRIEDVVTQPYDKITPAMQQVYYGRSPYNLVRIILGLPELFDEPGVNDVYTRAARDFREWRDKGVLQTDNDPSIFAYSQRFQVPGRPGDVLERRGFIALGGLEDYTAKVVFRHEQTLSKPKSDRLNLLKATRAHFGQIFMLYSDPAQSIEKILFQNFQPQIEVTDEYGVLHRVGRITDPHALRLVIGSMSDKKLIIADGHHRYETALNYSKEHAPAHVHHTRERDLATTLPHPPYPEAAAMMTFVNMDSEGLVILPTHRVVFGLEKFHPEAFLERAAPYFEIEKLSATEAPQLTAKTRRCRKRHHGLRRRSGGRRCSAEGQGRRCKTGAGAFAGAPGATRCCATSQPRARAIAGALRGIDPRAAQPSLSARRSRGSRPGEQGHGTGGLSDESRDTAGTARDRL